MKQRLHSKDILRLRSWRAHTVLSVGVVCLLMLLGLRMSSKAATQKPQELTVAAAASLRFAMDKMVDLFEQRHGGIRVKVVYGSSGYFYAMLSHQAPFDIFFSADVDYPRRLVKSGHGIKETQFHYARGRVVIWARTGSPIEVESLGMRSLLAPSIRTIAIANPRHAPYGRAAQAALINLAIYEQVKHKLVFGENVAQATHFVQSGSADIGIIALSLVLAPGLVKKGRYWGLPAGTYPPIEHGGVILHSANYPRAAERFRRFVLGPEGRTVFQTYGYLLPGD